MKFKIDLKIFLFAIIFYFTKQIQIYAILMVFALIHELGHLITGLMLGLKPNKLEIKPYGFAISFKVMPDNYNKKIKKGNLMEVKKIWIALAGPITNLFAIILVANLHNDNIFLNTMIIYANILIMLFNLIPMYPLDGGRILKSLLHICLGKSKAEIYTNNISFIILIIVTFFASIAILVVENIAIFLIVVVLWLMYIKEDIVYRQRQKIFNLVEKSLEIK